MCKATAEQFQVIDRKVVEAIAVEGATFEEDTFDGKKLKLPEIRRALRQVTDAQLCQVVRIAKVAVCKSWRLSRGMPLIGSTVGWSGR